VDPSPQGSLDVLQVYQGAGDGLSSGVKTTGRKGVLRYAPSYWAREIFLRGDAEPIGKRHAGVQS